MNIKSLVFQPADDHAEYKDALPGVHQFVQCDIALEFFFRKQFAVFSDEVFREVGNGAILHRGSTVRSAEKVIGRNMKIVSYFLKDIKVYYYNIIRTIMFRIPSDYLCKFMQVYSMHLYTILCNLSSSK